LKARGFDVEETFDMMAEHIDLFRDALADHDLHRSKQKIEAHVGCPMPVFCESFPMLDYGLSRKGASVSYMKAGSIHLGDGFDCIKRADTPETFVETYMPTAWYVLCRSFAESMHRLQKEERELRNHQNTTKPKGDAAVETTERSECDRDGVFLAEFLVVVDMEGMPRELFSKRTMELMQQSIGVIKCFPEIINKVIVINVPHFFALFWRILKYFLDADTVSKIGFYSSVENAKADLAEAVDPSKILVEYGGHEGNPTYEEALAEKLKREGIYDRYVFERYKHSKASKQPRSSAPTGGGGSSSVATTTTTLRTFALNDKERAELTVYTQAKLDKNNDNHFSGMKFLLLRAEGDPAGALFGNGTTHPRNNGGSGGAGHGRGMFATTDHKFGQPLATAPEHAVVRGPGNFRLVVATPTAAGGGASRHGIIEKALLVVAIR